MAFVRYQSPDDSSFLVFDVSRFRVDHAIFLLRTAPLRVVISERLDNQPDGGTQPISLLAEYRRLSACLEWLESLGDEADLVAIPGLEHGSALDLVADHLIGHGEFEKAYCPACETEFTVDRVAIEPWEFDEDGVTIRGRRSICPGGHTVHVLTEGIDAPDLETQDE